MAMRGLTSTIAGAVVLAGLGAYIFFVDADRPVGTTAEKERVFANVAADDIEEVTIAKAGGERTRLQKKDGTWRIVEPVDAEADEGEVSSIAGSLATLDVQQVVDEQATDFARYGLEPVRIDVSFRTKGGKEPHRVQFGDKAPAGGELYARLPGTPRVFFVSSFLDSSFDKDTFALRDKTILRFEREKVDSFEFTGPKSAMRFAKKGEEWTIAAPFAARADFGAVQGAVERLASARMQGLTEPNATDLKKYGLDRPSVVMTVGAGSSRASLAMGSTENAVVFAKDGSRPMVFTVAPTLRDDIVKAAGEYRRKDLFDSRSFTATRVELRRGSDAIVLEKSKGADGKEAWKNAAGAVVDTPKVEDLLTKLTGLRAESFRDASPASLKAVLTATVRFDPDKTESVSFGRAGTEVVATRTDEPGAAVLEAMAFDEMIKGLDAMK